VNCLTGRSLSDVMMTGLLDIVRELLSSIEVDVFVTNNNYVDIKILKLTLFYYEVYCRKDTIEEARSSK
jgi:hypothetical protein